PLRSNTCCSVNGKSIIVPRIKTSAIVTCAHPKTNLPSIHLSGFRVPGTFEFLVPDTLSRKLKQTALAAALLRPPPVPRNSLQNQSISETMQLTAEARVPTPRWIGIPTARD